MDFLLVHGSTQSPHAWEPLAGLLRERGHRSVAVDLPVDEPDLPAAGYAKIAAEQAAHLDRPVVVAHSAGGVVVPAIEAAVEARHIVWLGALLPDLASGRSVYEQIQTDADEMFGAEHRTWTESVTEHPALSAYFLFHDCDLATLRWGLTTLRLWQPKAVFGEHPETGPLQAPSTYVLPEDDRTLRPEWMRAAARERLGVAPIVVPGGHCPHVSRPDLIATMLTDLT